MLTDLERINSDVNAEVTFEPDVPGVDHWQTPYETNLLRKGDCEDIAIAKYFKLREAGYEPELMYCKWLDPITDESISHMVCACNNQVLDNLNPDVRLIGERTDLTPVYGISHKRLRVWGHDKNLPTNQHSAFTDLLARIAQGK